MVLRPSYILVPQTAHSTYDEATLAQNRVGQSLPLSTSNAMPDAAHNWPLWLTGHTAGSY